MSNAIYAYIKIFGDVRESLLKDLFGHLKYYFEHTHDDSIAFTSYASCVWLGFNQDWWRFSFFFSKRH